MRFVQAEADVGKGAWGIQHGICDGTRIRDSRNSASPQGFHNAVVCMLCAHTCTHAHATLSHTPHTPCSTFKMDTGMTIEYSRPAWHPTHSVCGARNVGTNVWQAQWFLFSSKEWESNDAGRLVKKIIRKSDHLKFSENQTTLIATINTVAIKFYLLMRWLV